MAQPAMTAPAVIVSSDTHIGPRLREDLRPYCEQSLLGAFDEFVTGIDAYRDAVYAKVPGRAATAQTRNRITAGHYDTHARLRDLDHDGVAAEIIFHGSQNEEPIPWGTFVVFLGPSSDDPELVAAGRRIYNRWLADFVSVEPHRHVGLAQLPMWDIDAAVRELQWAADAGLRGVNFPAPSSTLTPYNDPSWDRFFAACAERSMPLTTHAGAGDPSQWTGRETFALMTIESGGWLSRRALAQLIFGGVFERHRDLRLVLTEQPGTWWTYTLRELDSVWRAHRGSLGDQVPRPPSEYCREQVFLGASFLAHYEAIDAIDNDYVDNVLWGSDYPHAEGTWQMPDDERSESIGVLSMRAAFGGLDAAAVAKMAGENAARAYHLDLDALRAVAERIGAPTVEQLRTPIDAVPTGGSPFAFRTFGPWS
jgi:predicted TIM-barrel fold metal-dependent hydrolase